MVRQNALKIRCWQMCFWLESGVTTEGSCSLVLYYDHVNSITRNTQLLYILLCSYRLSKDPIYPRSFHNMTTIIVFHLNILKDYNSNRWSGVWNYRGLMTTVVIVGSCPFGALLHSVGLRILSALNGIYPVIR